MERHLKKYICISKFSINALLIAHDIPYLGTYLNSFFLSLCSFGTFSFWSAFLKPEGEVVVADGYASQETILLTYIKQYLPKWTLISDPCFTNTSSLDTVPRLTKLCHDKKDEYGIFDD